MSPEELTVRDYLPVLTALVGLVAGGIGTEIRLALAGSRERRRRLRVLLFELLELRFQVKVSDPRLVLGVVGDVAKRELGKDAAQAAASQVAPALFQQLQRTVWGQSGPTLARRYSKAIRAIASLDPLTAYELSGEERITKLEETLQQFHAYMSEHPVILQDPTGARQLEAAESLMTEVISNEVLSELAHVIVRIAWACSPRTWWRARRAIRHQDKCADEELMSRLQRLMHHLKEAAVRQSLAETKR